MPLNIVGEWDGGFIRKTKRGRVYVIRRSINGKRFDVSTGCSTSTGAMEQLRRFEADPEGYEPGAGIGEDAIVLDDKLIDGFLRYSRDVKKNGARWVAQQRLALLWWAEQIGGKDLRRVRLATDLLPALDDAKGRRVKIEVIKVLYAWLVKVRHLLKPDQDPTFRGLAVPQAVPEQRTRIKAIPKRAFDKVLAHLKGHWKDGLTVLAGTGWHVTELVRFAQDGDVEKHPQSGRGVLVCPYTKGKELLRVEVSDEVFVAGKRLLRRGTIDERRFYDAIRTASNKAHVTPITPGRLRHSVATWAINAGADPAVVSSFLGHKSPRTTRKFYATHAVPAKVPTLL